MGSQCPLDNWDQQQQYRYNSKQTTKPYTPPLKHTTNCVKIRHGLVAAPLQGSVIQWCGFKSRRGKNKHLTALKSNSNTVWFNFRTYIYIYYFNATFFPWGMKTQI
jgi:hypothetical protein